MTKRTTKTRPAALPDWGALADEAGGLKAAIAEATAALKPLQSRLDDIRALYVANGVAEADGADYRATVSTYERTGLDHAELLADLSNKLVALGVKPAWIKARIAAHTSAPVTVHSLRVVGRKATGVRSAA